MTTLQTTFKKDFLESLTVSAKRYEVKDNKSPGLRLVVYPAGAKTFILSKRVNGQQRRIRIGHFPDITIEIARKKAAEFRGMIAIGKDPEEEKRTLRYDLTFIELYQKYYDEHALPFTKDAAANKKMMEFHIFPVLGNKKCMTIAKDIIRKLHKDIGEKRGKGTANRVMAIVCAVFNHGIRNDHFNGNNPCTGLKKFKSYSRDRFLNTEELKNFFSAAEEEEPLYRDFFLLLLFTGARKSNVLSMKWNDIDLDLCRWRIAESDTKNKEVNIVILSKPALDILTRRRDVQNSSNEKSNFVFPGNGKKGHLDDPKRAFDRIRKRMNADNFRMHDLRRTLGSYMAINGISLPVIGKALNHKSQVSTAIYARLSQQPVEDAVNMAALNFLHSTK